MIGLALGITTATGLSLSSIATTTRLGAGGPYAIISESLGLEIGGAVGVPLHLSQALAVAMFIVNPTFSLLAWGMVVALYFWTMQGTVGRPGDDVRSGIFVAFAEWAAGKVTELSLSTARAWKPSFPVPVVDGAELRGELRRLADLCTPAGSIKLLGIADQQTVTDLTPRIAHLGRALRKQVFTTWLVIDSAGFTTGVVAGLQALRSAFFRPNVLFVNLPELTERYDELRGVLREARRGGKASCRGAA